MTKDKILHSCDFLFHLFQLQFESNELCFRQHLLMNHLFEAIVYAQDHWLPLIFVVSQLLKFIGKIKLKLTNGFEFMLS